MCTKLIGQRFDLQNILIMSYPMTFNNLGAGTIKFNVVTLFFFNVIASNIYVQYGYYTFPPLNLQKFKLEVIIPNSLLILLLSVISSFFHTLRLHEALNCLNTKLSCIFLLFFTFVHFIYTHISIERGSSSSLSGGDNSNAPIQQFAREHCFSRIELYKCK